MAFNLTQKLISSKLVSGAMVLGEEIGLKIDQALLQDVLGSLVMLELEAMGVERVKTNPSVQYIDHSLVQSDELNAETHAFLKQSCDKFGIWYSGPGNGISHPVHMEYFGVPGESIVGCDSHTTAAGALGMLAVGAGGIEVAMAMAGEPLFITMPEVIGVEVTGALPDWVSAKDVILELLRRHGVAGAKNCIIEYYGEGLSTLSAMDRHVIANMGTEMGATATVFPSDRVTLQFLKARGREDVWVALSADPGCSYDRYEQLNLSELEPMIALPSSPDNVVPVREVAGQPIYQSYIGSSANPGYRDFAVVAAIIRGRPISGNVSLDINPSTRQVLETLTSEGYLTDLIRGGARLHQAGCNGCIGMGQAPAVGQNSLRTVTRNFPGRSGTKEDSVFLCSPETAAASALTGKITDPRSLDIAYPRIEEPVEMPTNYASFSDPERRIPSTSDKSVDWSRSAPPIPALERFPENLRVEVMLEVGDNISTDAIIPAGNLVLPHYGNVHTTKQFAFYQLDASYPERAQNATTEQGHVIIGGFNYGQGSSRENAALVPRLLGLRVVVAKSFARIHWQNLVCFGVLPLTYEDQEAANLLSPSSVLILDKVLYQVKSGSTVKAAIEGADKIITLTHELSPRQLEILESGGVINWIKEKNLSTGSSE